MSKLNANGVEDVVVQVSHFDWPPGPAGAADVLAVAFVAPLVLSKPPPLSHFQVDALSSASFTKAGVVALLPEEEV